MSDREESATSETGESPAEESTAESTAEETVSGSTNEAATPESTTSAPESAPIDPEPMASDTAPDTHDEQRLRTNVERYVRYLLVAGLSLLALIAMIRFYFAASATIDTWISREYRSLFQALFNLALLLLAGAGIAWQARKLR